MKRRMVLFAVGLAIASCVGFQVGRLTSSDLQSELPGSKATGEPVISEASLAPVIGIASLTNDTYVRAIRASGGVPVVLPSTDGSPERIDDYLELLDGLVMPGGADIPPSEWGEQLHPTTNLLDDHRYQFEKAIITAWVTRTKKPLLGICLGSQWVNVAHGGSLIQDIPSEFGVNHQGTSHLVSLEPDSRLCRIFGETKFVVNSLHHQAVRDVGEGLRAVATSHDGIIEATETTDPDRFLIGVQWHPEKLMPEDRLQAKLLQAFVDACAKSAGANVLSNTKSTSGSRALLPESQLEGVR